MGGDVLKEQLGISLYTKQAIETNFSGTQCALNTILLDTYRQYIPTEIYLDHIIIVHLNYPTHNSATLAQHRTYVYVYCPIFIIQVRKGVGIQWCSSQLSRLLMWFYHFHLTPQGFALRAD